MRPQAAEQLVALGANAAERLWNESGGTPEGLAWLGTDIVEVFGRFDDARLRALLWKSLADPDFPWRPAAARGLATTAREDEESELAALVADPLAPVRVAGLEALEALDATDRLPLVRARLADEDDRVRRAAASLSHAWGDSSALWWLVEELARDDVWLGQETGRAARFDAARRLAASGVVLEGFAPFRPPDEPSNVAALDRLRERVRALAGERPELPAVARAGDGVPEAALGLEVESCRRGAVALAWTADDRLHVGKGNPAVVALPEGTVATLLESARPRFASLGDARLFGSLGCDLERYLLGAERAVQVAKGPDAVAGLRPDELGGLATALLATLPAAPPHVGDDPRLEGLRARTSAALAAVGGALPAGE